MSNKTINLQFKASAEGLKQVFDQIKKITAADNLNLTKGFDKQFKELEVKLPAYLQRINQIVEGDVKLSPIDVKTLNSEFTEIGKILDRTVVEIRKSNISAEINDQITKAEAILKSEQQKLNSLRGKIGGTSRKLDSSSKSGLAQTEENKEFSKIIEQQTGGKSLSIGDKVISDYQSFTQVMSQLGSTIHVTKEEQAQLTQLQTAATTAFAQRKAVIESEIASYKESYAAQKQQVAAAQQNVATVASSAAQEQAIGEQEKALLNELVQSRSILSSSIQTQARATEEATTQQSKNNNEVKLGTEIQKKNTSTIATAAKQVFSYGTIMSLFRRTYRKVISTVRDLDKALTDMAVVTSMSREDAYKMIGTFQQLGAETGKTSSEIANMTTKFLQQGKSISQALELTEAAAKAATIAGIDGETSINLLTNAMNGFQLSSNKAMEVSDKFAALAASAATDYEELATALSKVAAQANLAGMSMDFTLGMLTKGIEVTREAPETIGTALKTVIARMRELTDYGKTLEDNVDVNRVAKALDNIGVKLMDDSGQFRDLESVLTEVGQKWDTLNKNQQANVAVALAGTRQQSRLIAMMQDFDRTLELVDISANSYGATLAQHSEYMGGMEAATSRLSNSFESLISSIVDSETIIGIVNLFTGLVDIGKTLLSDFKLMVPILITIGILASNKLSTKLAEYNLTKRNRIETEQAHLEEAKQWSKQDLQNKKADLQLAKTLTKQAKNLLIEKKQTLEDIKQAKQSKIKAISEDKTLTNSQKELKIRAVEAEYSDDILNAEKGVNSAQQEYNNALKIEQDERAKLQEMRVQNIAYSAKSLEIQTMQNSQAGILGGLFNAILIPVQAFQSAMTTINTIQGIFIALKNKEIGLHRKNTAAISAEAAAEQTKAAWGMAGSAAAIPVAGWVIAGVILATILGLIIAAAVTSKQSGDQSKEAIAKTREELNQLQADLYNLNTAKDNVSKLGDEFDRLTAKVVKTNEQIERLAEIGKQINDEAGREIVNLAADYETQSKQIQAYYIQLEAQAKLKTDEINKTLGEGYKNTSNKETYFNTAKTDSAFVNSIRSVGITNLSGLEDVSAATQDAILDVLVNNIDKGGYFSESGLDTNQFEQYINSTLGSMGGYRGLIDQLEAINEDGSMTAYADMLSKLEASAGKNSALVEGLKESMPMLRAVSEMGTDVAKKFDAIGFSSEEINTIWASLEQSAKALGKDSGKMLADMTSKLGNATDLESRQLLYKELVATTTQARDAAVAAINDPASTYNANKTMYDELSEQITTLQDQLDDMNEGDKGYAEKQKQIDKLSEQAAGYKTEMEAVENAAYNTTEQINELRTVLGITNAQQITEEFTKLSSKMERFTEVTDLTSLSLSEQMELLTDYPELLAAMEKGYLTAAEAASIYGKNIEENLENIKANKSNYKVMYEGQLGNLGQFSNVFDDTEAGARAREEFLAMGALSEEDPWVAQMLSQYESFGFKTKGEMLQYLQGLQADIKDYAQQDYMETQLEVGNFTAIMSENAKKVWGEATSESAKYRNELEQVNAELEKMDKNDSRYNSTLQKRNDLLSKNLEADETRLAEIGNQKTDMLKLKSDNDLAKKSGITDLSQFITFINGQAHLDMAAISALDDSYENDVKNYISTVIESLNALAEEEKEINERREENYEALAQSFIDAEASKLEKQIETLEQQQEAYEKYFDMLDTLAEEEDRAANRQDVIKQLSAIAGGSDAASKQMRKDLLSQLEEINKEEEEARKQTMRDAVIEDIESKTEELNKQLDEVNDSLYTIIAAIQGKDVRSTVLDDGTVLLEYSADGGKTWNKYADGGLVDYTGPAWVDGSKSSPEAFLSAVDTKNMKILFEVLQSVLDKNTNVQSTASDINSNTTVVVEQVDIHTNELNNEQDFRTAGQIFAEEFGNAIRKGGFNINVKK